MTDEPLKHAKGPWEDTGPFIVSADGEKIACTYFPTNAPLRDSELARAGNGALIAAAPDLLDALIIAHTYVDSAYLSEGGEEAIAAKQDLDVINAAIAKASGIAP